MRQLNRILIIGISIFWVLSSSGYMFDGNGLVVFVLDVGQGDSILAKFPDGTTLLVDGGAGSKVLSELGEVLPPWKRTIDSVMLTHDHADHLNGLFDIVLRYKVKTVIVRLDSCLSTQCKSFVELSENAGVLVLDISKNTSPAKISLGRAVLSIFYFSEFRNVKEVNNSSIVAVITYGNFSMSLNGDLEIEGEERLIESWRKNGLGPIDVLKAGHHCSKTASSEEFLEYSRPVLAICSLGEGNSFGHPHREALNRFEEYSLHYLRTDENGRIVIRSDGTIWNSNSEK